MPETTTLVILFVVTCLAMAVGGWLLVTTKLRTDPNRTALDASGGGDVDETRGMRAEDWANAGVNLVVGVFLGLAIDGIAQLVAGGSWLVAVLIPLVFAVLFFLSEAFSGLIDRVFPSGIRRAHKPRPGRRKPLARRLGLPLGIVLGVGLARLGLGAAILGVLP